MQFSLFKKTWGGDRTNSQQQNVTYITRCKSQNDATRLQQQSWLHGLHRTQNEFDTISNEPSELQKRTLFL